MKNNNELINALNDIETEKGIDKELIFEAIETSLVTACKKHYGNMHNIKVTMDRECGTIDVFSQKKVVEEVTDELNEISLEKAREINPTYNLDDVVDIQVFPKDFGRISAQTAKQVVLQKFREAERVILYDNFIDKEREVLTGIVQRRDKNKKNIIVSVANTDAVLPASEQIPGARYTFNERMQVYVLEVKKTTKGPAITVSRTHPELVKRLFEQKVSEVHDGIVEIKAISREAGSRTKIAVYSNNSEVDAVGACVGINGYRVNAIVEELNYEKIDIIPWSKDNRVFIANALSPSKVVAVVLDEESQSAKVVVADNQLSLAIGKEGQNARLAVKLTGWKIDIKSESQAKEIGFIDESEYELAESYLQL